MMKLNITIKIFAILLLVSIALLVYRAINSEVSSTTIRYLFLDIFIEHKKYDLLLGSSTIKRLNQDKYLACGVWLNRGIGNSTVSNLNNYIRMTYLSIEPSRILLYAGENDISRGMSVDKTIDSYKKLVQNLIYRYPDSDIHIISIKPSPKRHGNWKEFNALNDLLEVFSGELKRVYFHSYKKWQKEYSQSSFVDDGIHLTDEGYYTFTLGFNKTCKIK